MCALMVLTETAYARDMTGKFGIGMGLTSEAMPTLTLRYWRTKVALEVMVGWSSQQKSLASVSVQAGKVLPATAGQAEPTALAASGCINAAKEIGATAASTTNCTATLDLSYLRLAIGVLFRLADSPRASLSFGVRPWALTTTQTLTETTANLDAEGRTKGATTSPVVTSPPWRWGVELPLVAEAFLTDNASIYGQVAVGIARGRPPEYARTTIGAHMTTGDLGLGTSGNFSGGAGFSYYF